MDHAFQSYYPGAMWLGPNGEIIQPVTVSAVSVKNTNNNLLVAAASGKCIRVLSLSIGAAEAAIGYITFKAGSGGTAQMTISTPSNASVNPTTIHPFNPAGWVNIPSGVGLYCDVGAGATVYTSLTYIQYTAVS